MRSVPLAMNARIAPSLPPSDSPLSTGAYCGLVICGLVWHTRQAWLKCLKPSSCCELRAGPLCWAAAVNDPAAIRTSATTRIMRAILVLSYVAFNQAFTKGSRNDRLFHGACPGDGCDGKERLRSLVPGRALARCARGIQGAARLARLERRGHIGAS